MYDMAYAISFFVKSARHTCSITIIDKWYTIDCVLAMCCPTRIIPIQRCKVQKANILSRVMRELHRYAYARCRAIDSQTLRTMKYFRIPAHTPPGNPLNERVTRTWPDNRFAPPATPVNRTGLSLPMRLRNPLRAIIRCLYYAMCDCWELP